MNNSDRLNRRFLVLARVGDNSLHKKWIEDGNCERTWDLALNAYGQDESLVQDGDLPVVIDRGTKWDSIVRQFKAQPDLLDRYDYVMFPDDDVLMEARDFNRLFEIILEHGLVMAQPSLKRDSYTTWPILISDPQFKLRFVNFIESMACCMTSAHFRQIMPMFDVHHTGWGTDLVWTMLMDRPAYKAAVIDEVSMAHTRPLYTGPLYKSYRTGLDPREEVGAVMNSFENSPNGMHVYGGVLKNGRRVGPVESRLRFARYIMTTAHRTKTPRHSLRTGAIMLARSLTQPNYRPETLRPVAGSRLGSVLSLPQSAR